MSAMRLSQQNNQELSSESTSEWVCSGSPMGSEDYLVEAIEDERRTAQVEGLSMSLEGAKSISVDSELSNPSTDFLFSSLYDTPRNSAAATKNSGTQIALENLVNERTRKRSNNKGFFSRLGGFFSLEQTRRNLL
jgi:hypothetical protein